jgi:hypothetical protein
VRAPPSQGAVRRVQAGANVGSSGGLRASIRRATPFATHNTHITPEGLSLPGGFDGEFDPGSGSTLAACLTHASRAGAPFGVRQRRTGEERVTNLP